MSLTTLLALLVVLGEWSGIARGIVGFPAFAALLDASLALLVVIAARRMWSAPNRRPLTVLGVLVLAYISVAALEMLNPNVPGWFVALEGFRKSAFTMIAFFAVLWAPEGSPARFFNIVAVGSIPAFLWATRQFFWPMPVDMSIIGTTGASSISFHSGAVLRAFSPTSGPFHLGIIAAAVMVISLVRSFTGSRWWIVLSAAAGWTLGLTITRANIVGGVVAIAVVLAASLMMRAGWLAVAKALVPALACLLAVMIAVGAVGIPRGGEPAPSVPASSGGQPSLAPTPKPDISHIVSGITNPFTDRSLQFRLEYWTKYLKAIAARPLVGYGTSSAADGFGAYYTGTYQNFEPHSMYLKPALEQGLGGLALFLAVMIAALACTLALARTGEPTGLIVLGVGVALAVSGLTGPMLDAYPFNLLFWASCGWMARLARTSSRVRPLDRAVQVAR